VSENSTNDTSRREFLKTTSRIAVASAIVGATVPRVHAAENNTLQVALIGCGGRGTGAAADAMSVKQGPVKLVAMSDIFEDRVASSYANLDKRFGERMDVPEDRRFVGFDGYKKAMDCLKPGDIAIFATPLAFRWVNFAYAVQKGLHVFMEKPVTADGPTSRRMLEIADQSVAKNLKVGVGLMSRHSRAMEQLYARIQDGEIGDITSMRAYRMTGPIGSAFSTKWPGDQVLAEAEAEFRRVERDMYVIARQLWGRYYRDQPLPPDDETGRRAAIAEVLRAVGQEHGPPETLTQDARATVDRIRQFIRTRNILRLPDPDRCQVIEMPEFQRGNSTAYLNSAPPLDPTAPSVYAVSPPPRDWDPQRVKSLLEEYNRHMLQILTIHEAYPGHYVQLEYANRVPSLIRRVLGSGVYIEGWAVYTEQMMLDQGYGDGDLALRLTQLKFYLRAVANAILDHRMHCSRMTDDEALTFLMQGAFQSEGEARLKVIRAKQSSCQLSTYFVGRMAMYRLRQEIQREQGDDFRLDRYHEAILNLGGVPVKYLPRLVREAFEGT